MDTMTKAVKDVLAERQRQIHEEGRDSKHDDRQPPGVLAHASMGYAQSGAHQLRLGRMLPGMPLFWPWAPDDWEPATPRQDLVKAAALLLAEIERLDRQESPSREEQLDQLRLATVDRWHRAVPKVPLDDVLRDAISAAWELGAKSKEAPIGKPT